MKEKKPLLTISLLISNRPDTIPRCLDSLKLIMDKLPCELILIDTSKSKEIHELLLTYTNQVYEFEWCRDFAKARNEGVKRAKGEWFLYLDDDEWLAEVDEIIDFFKSKKYKKYQCANILVRNFLNPEYTDYSDLWVTRLFYLGGGAKFVGKIHESIYPIYNEPMFLNALFNHSGYIFDTEEKKQKHFERNSQMLLEALEEEPTNLRMAAQLVQEYRSIEDWESSIKVCKEHIKHKEEITGFMERNHFCTMYAGLVEGLTKLKKEKEALEICDIGLEDARSTDLLKSFLYFYKMINYTELEEWSKARESFDKYLERYEYFKKNKDSMNDQMGALIVHRIFEHDFVEKAYNILVYTELKKEKIDMLFSDDEEEKEVTIDALSGMKFVRAMINLISTKEYTSAFEHFLKNISQNEQLCEWACAEVQQLEEKDEDAFQRCAYAFSKAESDFWYICYCRVMEADVRESKDDVEHAMEELLNVLPVVCYMPDRLYGVIDKYDIKVALLWDKVAGEQWTSHVSRLVNECEDIYIDKAYDYLLNVYEEDDWHVNCLVSALQEKMLLAQQREEMNTLREQILSQVKALREAGQEEMAEQFMEQLKVLFPNEEEV